MTMADIGAIIGVLVVAFIIYKYVYDPEEDEGFIDDYYSQSDYEED